MENFVLYNPVKLHFGRGVVNNLGKSVSKYGKRVLLVYGGGSIKKNGIYVQVMDQMKKSGLEVFEYQGINRITSYNVCYTKLLRGQLRLQGRIVGRRDK